MTFYDFYPFYIYPWVDPAGKRSQSTSRDLARLLPNSFHKGIGSTRESVLEERKQSDNNSVQRALGFPSFFFAKFVAMLRLRRLCVLIQTRK
jgi:hypothetical protein